MQECVPTEVVTEMGDTYVGCNIRIFLKIGVVKSPVMWQVGAYEDHVPRPESLHIISYELSALSSLKMYQFNFCMKMPAIVDIRDKIPPDAERVSGFP